MLREIFYSLFRVPFCYSKVSRRVVGFYYVYFHKFHHTSSAQFPFSVSRLATEIEVNANGKKNYNNIMRRLCAVPYPHAHRIGEKVFLYLGLFCFVILLGLIIFLALRGPLRARHPLSTFKPQKTIFLMRSYNRPEYLQKTLDSVARSDVMQHCHRCIIYDDASTNPEVEAILKKFENRFEVLRNKKNLRQNSMVALLDFVQNTINTSTYDYICYLDNDALVKTNFVQTCMATYKKIQDEQQLASHKFILTGFNTANHPIESVHDGYAKKKSIGGIHMHFHRDLLQKIRNWWNLNLDWGVVHGLRDENGHMYCCLPGVVEHIGQYGDHSRPDAYDKAV